MMRAVTAVLISEDENLRLLVQKTLESEGHTIVCASTPAEAASHVFPELKPDLLLLDTTRGRNTTTLFPANWQETIRGCRVTVLSEMGDDSWQRHAERCGVHSVLNKPLLRQDLERLVAEMDLQIAAAEASAPATAAASRHHVEELENGRFFFAASPAMLNIYKNIRILAPVDIPVLILGESGVGKEIVAMLLHKYHGRPGKNFVNVNCAALPTELLESELFGYEVGAFTGAVRAKPGKFELADKGTLLLDEIGEMSPQMQAKLLHVLQDGTFSRLGARTSSQVDVRVVAATNIDMEAAMAEKRFREDLYYRLSTFAITIPPLRQRREEIPFLMQQLIARAAAELDQQPIVLTDRVLGAAQEYSWPGNLRELRNFIIRTLVLQDQETACNELRVKTRATTTSVTVYPTAHAASHSAPSEPLPPRGMRSVVNDVKNETESRMIQKALAATGWNRRRAATNLNISYRALLYKIQQHGLSA
jgi:two-component system, NtrC family, response regulator AtoC